MEALWYDEWKEMLWKQRFENLQKALKWLQQGILLDEPNYEIFGSPDQIELVIIIRNGALLLFVLKTSKDRLKQQPCSCKIASYKKPHQRQAERQIVIYTCIHPSIMSTI